jgi:23S rRNA pseudouridine1911/1915/1917 synthase
MITTFILNISRIIIKQRIKMNQINKTLSIAEEYNNHRLDQALAKIITEHSRSTIKKWIENGCITVNGTTITSAKTKVKTNEQIIINAELKEPKESAAQEIPLNIIYEDDDLLILNKPSNLVVHPGAGNPDYTLVNALIHYDPNLKQLPRGGLIHRLDKNTTGLIIIGKNPVAYNRLAKNMQERKIKRHYIALCQGRIISGNTIDLPIDRDPRSRVKMAVCESGRRAVTHYRVNERFRAHTLINVELETGRTHQIRVHLNHSGYPLVGDPTYRKQIALECPISEELKTACRDFKRQALHAARLMLNHPITGLRIEVTAPLPEDFEQLLKAMQLDRSLKAI